ncbi:MAG: rhamnan synthesis F family protein [Bacteroidales bacterium]|nr:rhamnan synthesis F family protein [Bacteroidales bacterium]
MFKTIKHFIGSFFSKETRENVILFFKSKNTRKNLIRKLRINKFSKNNCFYISHENLINYPTTKIAIQIHIFYIDLLSELYSYIQSITINYDLYISTSDNEKMKIIKSFFYEKKLFSKKITIQVVENRGRDVWPFLKIMYPIYSKYDYIVHIHTKKSVTQGERGNSWRKYLFQNILGEKHYFDNVIKFLYDNPLIGFVSPPPFNDDSMYWAYFTSRTNKYDLKKLYDFLNIIGVVKYKTNPLKYQFPAGNMFIAKVDAIKQIFEHNFLYNDFPIELNQQGGTLQHTIEHCWHYLVDYNNYKYCEIFNIN